MSFRVGQRVRKVADPKPEHYARHISGVKFTSKNPVPIGATGVVVIAEAQPPFGFVVYAPLVTVLFDDMPGKPRGVYDYMIEPLDDDDSRRVVSWDECVWRPGKVSA